jgi:glucosamine-phosphate N-acetyltransferase
MTAVEQRSQRSGVVCLPLSLPGRTHQSTNVHCPQIDSLYCQHRSCTMSSTPEEPLFDPDLLPKTTYNVNGILRRVRPLRRSDYSKGFLQCLNDLTWIGDFSEEQFGDRYQWLATKGQGWYYCIVIEHKDEIIATATLVVERKLCVSHTHSCGTRKLTVYSIHNRTIVGHVEEVVVRRSHQKTGLGLFLMYGVEKLARNVGVRNIILNCSEENQAFYEKCGYAKSGQEMKLALESESHDRDSA